MLKIGEFSKLSHLTVKALRLYETSQLEMAARIKAYRQLDLSIDEIRAILSGMDAKLIFEEKAKALQEQKNQIDVRLSIINHIWEDKEMKYQVNVKEIPAAIVYYSEVTLPKYKDMMQYIPAIGEECMHIL